jgi:hypothetical protein
VSDEVGNPGLLAAKICRFGAVVSAAKAARPN